MVFLIKSNLFKKETYISRYFFKEEDPKINLNRFLLVVDVENDHSVNSRYNVVDDNNFLYEMIIKSKNDKEKLYFSDNVKLLIYSFGFIRCREK